MRTQRPGLPSAWPCAIYHLLLLARDRQGCCSVILFAWTSGCGSIRCPMACAACCPAGRPGLAPETAKTKSAEAGCAGTQGGVCVQQPQLKGCLRLRRVLHNMMTVVLVQSEHVPLVGPIVQSGHPDALDGAGG